MNTVTAVPTSLDAPDLLQWLEAVLPEDLDELPFGIIAMAPDCTVQRYNLAESRLSGLTPCACDRAKHVRFRGHVHQHPHRRPSFR